MKKILMVTVVALCAAGMLFASGGSQPSGGAAQSGGGAPAEIRVEVFNRGTDGGRSDPTNNNYTKWIQEKLLKDENIKVIYVSVPRSDEIPSLNNLMAAGDAPDIVFTYTQQVMENYRDMGGLFDIAPYVSTLLPDLDKFLGEDPGIPGQRLVRRYTQPETGSVWALPARRIVTARIGTFIRKDWLDKLGLGVPKTEDEFYAALKAFKEKDPGNVGRDKVIPYDMNFRPDWAIGNLIESYIDPNTSVKDIWINTVVDRTYLLPGFKEGVRTVNKWFNEGLIEKDFPLFKNDDNVTSNLKAGFSGAYARNYDDPWRDSPGINRDLGQNVPGAFFVACDPFKKYGGRTVKRLYDPTGLIYFIPKSSKNPQAALRYINWLARNENSQFIQLGPEGTSWTMGSDGLPNLKQNTADLGLWIQNSPNNIDYTLHINGVDLGDPQKNLAMFPKSYGSHPAQQLIDAFNLGYAGARGWPVSQVTLTEAGQYAQALQDLGDQWMTEAIMASPANFDRVYDAGRQRWLDAGAQAIINERAAKYQAAR